MKTNITYIKRSLRPAMVGVTICVLFVATGCQSGNHYTAQSLPQQFYATPRVSLASLDLSRMRRNHSHSVAIGAGDELNVVLASGEGDIEDENWNVRVANDGTVDVPYIGSVRVAGYEVEQAESLVRQAGVERDLYRNPHVALTLKQRKVNRVTVSGAVNQPGVYELPTSGSDLVAALMAAGGLSDSASQVVEINNPINSSRQAGPRSVNLLSALRSASGNAYLHDGSSVNVRIKEEELVHVIGNVTRNQSIQLQPGRDMRVLDAIADVGGLSYSYWVSDRIDVIRQLPGRNESVKIRVSARKAKNDATENIRLAPGDVVSIEENVVTFALNTLKGVAGIGASTAVALRGGF